MVVKDAAVAIAGLGVVSGYGWGLGELWKGLTSGKSAATPDRVRRLLRARRHGARRW